jgi:tetratricopeptide (TPR) repeat protein
VDDEAKEPLALGSQVDLAVNAQFDVPQALVAKPPVPVTIDTPLWSYRSTYDVKPGKLLIARRLVVKTDTVNPDRFVAYKAFLKAVSADRRQTFAIGATKNAAKIADDVMTLDQLVGAAGRAYGSGDYTRAVALYRRAVEKSPKHETAWNDLGRALVELGQLNEAIAAYDLQIAQNPFNEYAYNNRGLAEWRQQKLDAAEASFRKQIEVSPLDKYAYANLGLLQFERNRVDDAIGSLEKAVAIAPGDRRALVGLGRAYLAAKRPTDAVEALKRTVADNPSPMDWNNAAWWLAEAGVELDLALDYAQKAVRGNTLRLGRRAWPALRWVTLQPSAACARRGTPSGGCITRKAIS